MHGNHPGDERLDPGGFETPFSERLDTLESSDSRGELGFDATGFVAEPTHSARQETRTDSEWLESEVNAAETEAAAASEAEWLETEWLETPGGDQTENVESFAERLGRAWSSQRNGDPTPEAMKAWLIQDHDDTVAAAKLRWRSRKVGADFWQRVSRAWMISREEQMRFQPNFPGVGALGPFAPPSAKAALVTDPIIEGSNVAPVAPLTLRFARQLRQRYPGASVSNYRGHGGGAFLNRGYSLDIFIPGRDSRGFYKKEDAIRLLRAVHAAAGAVQARWRVIYNDFAVADAVNRQLGRRHVIFVGAAQKNKAKMVTGLNWHGPDPLILHFHLDLAPLGGANLDEAETPTGETVSEAGCGCGSKSSNRETEWLDPSGEVQSFNDEQFDQLDQFDPENTMGEDRMGEDREDRETERGRYDAAGEDEQFQDLDTSENESNPLEAAGLSTAERKALEITSTLETGKRGGFYGLSGNFDGQGLSFGLVNWTIGTGSLQPLLRDFAREQPARWAAIFGGDAGRFLTLITPKSNAAIRDQHRFAIEEMNAKRTLNGRTLWSIREPWQSRFRKLSEDPAFQQIQIRYVRDLLARAAYFCRYFSLTSERAFAFMFDAVSSHGKWWLTKKIGGVEKRRQLLRERLAAGKPPELELLLIIAEVLGATSAPRWAEKVRARKRWFVTGQHPRARELAGLEPSPNKPWTLSAGVERKETGESLDWLDFESPLGEDESTETRDETEDYAEPEVQGFDQQGFDQGEWQPSEAFLESVTEAAESIYARFDEAEDEQFSCTFYPTGYEKLIRQKGTKEGEVLDRTSGDRTTNLSLQFRDYDVNAYLAGTKSAHSFALARVTEFLQARLVAGAPVEVTITGSASKTGTATFNQQLSEKRASCMASLIKTSLGSSAARVRFNERGEGFTNATCKGADCELPGFRSVLVSIHAPNQPPPPVPPEIPGWDKYEIRCCAFQSTSLGEVVIDELLNKLPGGLPREIAEKLTPILKKRLEAALKRLLKRLPKLGRLVGDLSKLLKFLPIEVTRQKAIFQIRERGKPDPAITTLCYDGFGGRLALPIPGTLDDALDEILKKIPGVGSNDTAREALKKVIKAELEKILPERVRKTLSKLDSTVPGPWKPFDLNRKATLAVFAVDADIFVDLITGLTGPGRIMLGFDGGQWTLPDPARRIRLSCPDCATSIIPVTVDGGNGVDLLSVNKGKLVPRGCACSEQASEAELFAFA
jgi:hypothetical protein